MWMENGHRIVVSIGAHPRFFPWEAREAMLAHHAQTAGRFERATDEQHEAVSHRIANYVPEDSLRALRERTVAMSKAPAELRAARESPGSSISG